MYLDTDSPKPAILKEPIVNYWLFFIMHQIILSTQRLVHEFLIPLIDSLLIHALVFFTLANYISGYTNKQQAQSKETLTVNLKPRIYKDLASADSLITKNSEPPLSKTEDKPTKVNGEDANGQLFELPISPYYTIKELDKIPSILENVDSNRPELLQFPQGGELTIRVWIDDKGSVIKLKLLNQNCLRSLVKAY